MRQILKRSYYLSYCIDHNQILHSDRDHWVLSVGGPNVPKMNPRLRTAAILKKNRKTAISSQQIGLFWQNLAWWCISTISTPSANKISRFQKSVSNVGRQPFWEIEKNRNISAIDGPTSTKFGIDFSDGNILFEYNVWRTEVPHLCPPDFVFE